MSQLNLLPDHYQQARRRRRCTRAAALGFAVLVLLVGTWASLAYRQVAALDKQIERLEREVQPVRRRHHEFVNLKRRRAALRTDRREHQALQSPLPITSILRLLDHDLPAGMALTQMRGEWPPPTLGAEPAEAADNADADAESDTEPPAAKAIRLRLSGITKSQAAAGRFVTALGRRALFENVSLHNVNGTDQKADEARYSFQITLTIPMSNRLFNVTMVKNNDAH